MEESKVELTKIKVNFVLNLLYSRSFPLNPNGTLVFSLRIFVCFEKVSCMCWKNRCAQRKKKMDLLH